MCHTKYISLYSPFLEPQWKQGGQKASISSVPSALKSRAVGLTDKCSTAHSHKHFQ